MSHTVETQRLKCAFFMKGTQIYNPSYENSNITYIIDPYTNYIPLELRVQSEGFKLASIIESVLSEVMTR